MASEVNYFEIINSFRRKEKPIYNLMTYDDKLHLISTAICDSTKIFQNISNYLEKAIKCFISKLFKSTINDAKKIERKSLVFIKWINSIILNFSISQEILLETIISILFEMKSKLDKKLSNQLSILVNSLKENCKLPTVIKKNFFFTTTLDTAEQDFFLKMLTIDEDSILNKIENGVFNAFEDFISDKNIAKEEIYKFKLRYLESYNKIKLYYEGVITKRLKGLYDFLEFQQFCIYKSEIDMQTDMSIIKITPK